MMEQGQARPFCFFCGYDLSGLDLPHPCPECSQLDGPERQTEEARRWFAGRRAWFWLFTRSSKIPPALLYALQDPTSSRLARRRMFLGIILPALLTAFIVFGGSTIGVKKKYKIWYYLPSDENRTPWWVSTDTEVDHLYSFNLHLDIFGFHPPSPWVKQSELLPDRSYSLSWPPVFFFDFVALIHAGPPWVILLFGYLPCRTIMMTAAKKASQNEEIPHLRASLKSALVLPCAGLAIVNWGWLAVVIFSGISDLVPMSTESSYFVDDVLGYSFISLIGIAALSTICSWPCFIRLERGRRLFEFPVSTATLLVLINVGGPVSFTSLIVWIYSKL